LVLPAVLGAFWGAPLVARELEAGTHRLVWNQSVTRTRWLAVKLSGVGLVAVAGAALLSLAVTWWCGPIDDAATGGYGGSAFLTQPRITPPVFGARGVVPVAYTAFAFALGVTVGIMLRRTVAAIALTLVVFVGAQVAVTFWVRPHLAEPVKIISVISVDNLDSIQSAGPAGPIERIGVDVDASGAWLLSDRTLDPAGRVATVLPAWLADCV
nr:ABC transporter permease [Micromonospora sp. DSM 115978]